MHRRAFLAASLGAAAIPALSAGLPKSKITRIRYFKTPTDAAGRPNTRQPLFNQSTHVVIVETDTGLTGIGEGGAPDTMEQCAGLLIGEDPFRTDRLWQTMYRAYFYPAGREKVRRWERLTSLSGISKERHWGRLSAFRGRSRDHVECYSTGFPLKAPSARWLGHALGRLPRVSAFDQRQCCIRSL
ncbi:MAG: hypothetical protein WKF37_25320 [Bryobacteraceae bacterium]